jgi:hypothetical protein
MMMINLRNAIAALALGLAVAAAASPALAKERTYRNTGQPGHAARAQAIGGEIGENGMSQQRINALRTCNERANRYLQHTYGNMQSYAYRACMTEHGEIE